MRQQPIDTTLPSQPLRKATSLVRDIRLIGRMLIWTTRTFATLFVLTFAFGIMAVDLMEPVVQEPITMTSFAVMVRTYASVAALGTIILVAVKSYLDHH